MEAREGKCCRAQKLHSSEASETLGGYIFLDLHVSANLRISSSENNIYAGAFHCAFTVDVEGNVAVPEEIIAFMRSEGKVT